MKVAKGNNVDRESEGRDRETLQQDEDNSNIEGQMERTTQMLERGRSGAESIFP